MEYEKVALFYGHSASNIGDLAINTGECNLLRLLYPNAELVVVFMDSERSLYLESARQSFLDGGDATFRYLDTGNVELLKRIAEEPGYLLEALDILDCDAIWIASGEHLFSYSNQKNNHAICWRTFPILAAKEKGKFAGILPSTYGPFSNIESKNLLRDILGIADLAFVRDLESYKLVSDLAGEDIPIMGLDPAFCLDYQSLVSSERMGRLGIVMRSEGWGIRLPAEKRKAMTREFREASYQNSSAFEFSVKVISTFIDKFPEGISIFVQTVADEELAKAILDHFRDEPEYIEKLNLVYPSSVDDYLRELSKVDELITSRFHAAIFGLMLNKRVYSAYFDNHGHKMPGLFRYLGIEDYCINLPAEGVDGSVDQITKLSSKSWNKTYVSSNVSEKLEGMVHRVRSANSSNGSVDYSELRNRFSRLLLELVLDSHLKDLSNAQNMLEKKKREVVELECELKNNRQDLIEVKSQRNELKRHLVEQKKKQKELLGSTTYRVGLQVVRDLKRPHHWPLLPFKMFRLFNRYQRRIASMESSKSPNSRSSQRRVQERDLLDILPQSSVNIDLSGQKVRRICYLLHNSLPYSSGGYATRAHGVACGLRDNGYEVVCLTRPGFPLDVSSGMDVEDVEEHEIDGIVYKRIKYPLRKGRSTGEYMHEILDPIENALREIKPDLVIGASFYLTALPGLIAAKRNKIPFVYEIRGLAEITKISRDPTYGETEAYRNQIFMEAQTAKHADHVWTLTHPMKEEMVNRGVTSDKISLLPNSANLESFNPRPRDRSLASELGIPKGIPVIGYIGTFVDYEGLEDLVYAAGMLKLKGVEFRLLVVGSENVNTGEVGPITRKIKEYAEKFDLASWLIMPGRVPHEKVESYYSLIDIAPFPRKPWPVCEMVSPMKPLEAMAMEKVVVVSSVRALSDMVHDGVTGCIFEKGNPESLSEILSKLIGNKEMRSYLGANARTWVGKSRSWSVTTNTALSELSS